MGAYWTEHSANHAEHLLTFFPGGLLKIFGPLNTEPMTQLHFVPEIGQPTSISQFTPQKPSQRGHVCPLLRLTPERDGQYNSEYPERSLRVYSPRSRTTQPWPLRWKATTASNAREKLRERFFIQKLYKFLNLTLSK